MGKNFNLKAKMLAFILFPTVVAFILFGYLSYYNAKQAISSQVKEVLAEKVNSAASDIQVWLESKEALSTNVAVTLVANQFADGDIMKVLQNLRQANPGVVDVYVGFEDGKFLGSTDWVPPSDYDPRTRPWYKKALLSNNVEYSDVYQDANTKQLLVSVAHKVEKDGKTIGVVGVDLDLADLKQIAAKAKVASTGYAFILDSKGFYLYHPTLSVSDNILTISNGVYKESGEAFLSGKSTAQELMFGATLKLLDAKPISSRSGWVLVMAVPQDELFEGLTSHGRQSLFLGVIFSLIIGGLIFVISSRISRPLRNLVGVVETVANGNLSIQKIENTSSDEAGKLGAALNQMVVNLRNLIKQVAESAEQVAASSEELTASAEQSAQAANQVAGSITAVAQGAEDQITAVNDTSAVVEQMSAGIQQVAADVNKVAGQSVQAADKASQGNNLVDKAVKQMNQIEQTVTTSAGVVAKLGERSKEIGQIVDTISGIAGQTNLLALNAAIEAARAGEQGRGFAVVAEEVRKLAEQSQEAAKQIASLINEIQNDTDEAVVAMNDGTREVKLGAEVVNASGQAFQEIVVLVTQVSDQVKGISLAIEQMATGSQRIVESVTRIEGLSKNASGEAQTVSAAT
ncbi:MAG TPA: methyl-accepting chemotaxis protein, partial [Negativicutes bacterium]